MIDPSRKSAEIRSSVVYQLLLYLDAWYFAAFVSIELLLFIYKGIILPYPSFYYVSELILLGCLSIVEAIRNFFGQKGNLTEHSLAVILSVVLTIPSFVSILYYLLWQTYILRIEVILTSVQLVFQGLQLVLAIFCIVNFSR